MQTSVVPQCSLTDVGEKSHNCLNMYVLKGSWVKTSGSWTVGSDVWGN